MRSFPGRSLAFRTSALAFPAAVILFAGDAAAATLTVGAGKMYATPCAAIAAASPGDSIDVDPGSYDGDTCAWSTDNLTVRGVGGMAKIDLTGVTPNQEKGIFTITAPNATLENFELSGASISAEGNNGAGIRHQGQNLTVRGCYIHDNQDGILGAPFNAGNAADGTGTVVIENTEFDHNGAGDGYSHNMYLNHYASFTLSGSWSHNAVVGHLVKTRADVNYILYNRITDEDGTASYEIDVPNGGKTYIIGNVIQQGTMTQNPAIITYEEEGTSPTNTSLDLFVVNNSIVNDLGSGTFLHVGADVTTPAVVENNIFVGAGTVVDQATAAETSNFTGDPMFVDQTNYDYRLMAGSPCIDHGTTPGMGDGYALTPTQEYVQPVSTVGRTIVDVIDIGAYEYGGAVDGGAGAGGSAAATTTSTASGSASTGNGAGGASSGSTGAASTSNGAGGGSGNSPKQSSGCSCDVAGASGTGEGLLAVTALTVISLARRRRSKGQTSPRRAT
jgi:MYXO-CTERM domain-containing protein